MIIKQDHWCPKCRIMQIDWRVPASGLKKKIIRPGDPWPPLEPIHTEAVDVCKACGEKIKGRIVLKINEHGEPEKIYGVKEIDL